MNEGTLPERFWAKVDRTGACWLWTGSLNHHGYGRFRWDGENRLAHRVAYSVLIAPLAKGLEVDHKCHTPRCVNPDHLQAVTHGKNQENRASARRDSASGVRGVYYDARRGKYEAYATLDKVKYSAGVYDDLESAAEAARAMRNRLHTNNLTDRAVA